MKNKKIQTKDLITIGIFTAIYFITFFACGLLGYIPILFVLLPVYFPIITGIPVMLFLTKVDKFGMVMIMAIISGFFMFVTGHTWMPLATAFIFGFLADLILRIGNYKSFKSTVLGFGVFTIWPIGAMLPMWVMREKYFNHMRSAMGDEYTNRILELTPNWLPFAFIITAFFTGIVGAFVGKSVLKKHFLKAGIV